MSRGHPRDAEGRVLPEPSWPAERAAPGDLELVRRLCNSINRENDADRFRTAAGFDRWLVSEGRPATRPGDDELTLIHDVREELHQLTLANRDAVDDPAAWRRLASLAAPITFAAGADAGGLELYAQGPTATHRFAGELVLICIDAVRAGTWARLKSCDHCQWTIFDSSKNRSGRWCSMAACGGRHNARHYRRRKRAISAGSSSATRL